MNVTVPSGVPSADITAAERFTLVPQSDGFGADTRSVVVAAGRIVQEKVAGLASTWAMESVDRTWKVCVPRGRVVNVCIVRPPIATQAPGTPLRSSRTSNVLGDAVEANVNVAVREPLGTHVIEVIRSL